MRHQFGETADVLPLQELHAMVRAVYPTIIRSLVMARIVGRVCLRTMYYAGRQSDTVLAPPYYSPRRKLSKSLRTTGPTVLPKIMDAGVIGILVKGGESSNDEVRGISPPRRTWIENSCTSFRPSKMVPLYN